MARDVCPSDVRGYRDLQRFHGRDVGVGALPVRRRSPHGVRDVTAGRNGGGRQRRRWRRRPGRWRPGQRRQGWRAPWIESPEGPERAGGVVAAARTNCVSTRCFIVCAPCSTSSTNRPPRLLRLRLHGPPAPPAPNGRRLSQAQHGEPAPRRCPQPESAAAHHTHVAGFVRLCERAGG